LRSRAGPILNSAVSRRPEINDKSEKAGNAEKQKSKELRNKKFRSFSTSDLSDFPFPRACAGMPIDPGAKMPIEPQ
jgi:hypothetical protein